MQTPTLPVTHRARVQSVLSKIETAPVTELKKLALELANAQHDWIEALEARLEHALELVGLTAPDQDDGEGGA